MARNVVQKVKEIIARQFGVKPSTIKEEMVFIEDLKADPLDLVELMITCEEEFLISIPMDDSEKLTTVGSVIEYIRGRVPN